MTDIEKKQSHHIFVSAGRKAFRMNVPLSNNPYKQDPWRDLWDKGWRFARKEEDMTRPDKRPAFKEQDEPRYDPHQRLKPREWKERKPAQPQPQPQPPIVTERLVNRFNRKYRTNAA